MNGDHSLAVHALVYLDHRATHLPSQILAENICTNAARVRKVMRPLASAGLIATKEGAEGGYALARPAAEITLRAVAEATGTTFVKVNWTPGDVHEDCLVSSSMGAVMNDIYAGLNRTCLEQLEHTTIHDITEQIFSERKGLIIPRVSPSQHQSITLRQSKKKTDAARHTTHQHNALLSLEYVRK